MESSFYVALALGFALGFGAEWAYDLFVSRGKRTERDSDSKDSEQSKQIAELMAENEALRSQLAANLKEVSQIGANSEELDLLRATVNDLSHQLESSEVTHSAKFGAKVEELEMLREELNMSRETVGALENRVQELEADVDEHESRDHQVSKLQADHDALNEQLQTLKDQLLERDQELARTHQELFLAKESLVGAEDVRVLAARAAALEREVESLKSISSAKDEAVHRSQETVERLEAQLASRPRPEDVQFLNEQLSERQNDIASLEARTSELERALDEREALTEGLSAPDQLLGRLGDLESAHHQMIDLLASKDDALAAAQAKAELMAQEFAEEKKTLEALLAERNQALAAVTSERDRLLRESTQNTPSGLAAGDSASSELEKLKAVMTQREEAMRRLEDQVSFLVHSFKDVEELKSKLAAQSQQAESRPVLSVTSFANDGGSKRDPLIQIRGIGHLFERKLWDAGVYTFAQLAALKSDEIYEIIQPAEWQTIEPERWIAEAASLSLGTGT